MNKRLPDKDSNEGQIIIQKYLAGERATLADECGYPNVASFTRAMRQVYGVKVGANNTGWEPGEINIPLTLNTTNEIRTAAILNDTHNPYHDAVCLSLVERFLQDREIHYMFYNGDMNDFYGLSKFNKNPLRINNLQKDIDSTKYMLDRHNKLFPNAKKIYGKGNHEDRLTVFLWNNAAVLSSLKCLDFAELMGLKDLGVQLLEYEQGLMVNNDFLVIHGNLVSVHSSYTAKRLHEKHGGNGICGHTHRGGVFYKRDRFGTYGWWENFCLCHLNPDWIKHPNWQQGFSLVHFKGKRFHVEPIPIIDHTIMYGGRIYR